MSHGKQQSRRHGRPISGILTRFIGHDRAVEKQLDLDEAHAEIQARVPLWQSAGLTVAAITWRDQGRGWPPPITSNRDEVIEADSVGVAITKGTQEGRVVVFDGGWADFDYLDWEMQDNVVSETPGWGAPLSASEFGEVLDRLAALFR